MSIVSLPFLDLYSNWCGGWDFNTNLPVDSKEIEG